MEKYTRYFILHYGKPIILRTGMPKLPHKAPPMFRFDEDRKVDIYGNDHLPFIVLIFRYSMIFNNHTLLASSSPLGCFKDS